MFLTGSKAGSASLPDFLLLLRRVNLLVITGNSMDGENTFADDLFIRSTIIMVIRWWLISTGK
jgi:hypothetical protein